ncbi:hypothetical protein EYC08_01910 [Tabrizicola sp. WMC-M-20]|nr:hypothetical protein EYC08_01910 [Tabrizicola sp. WMC-M-20]
MAKCWRPRGSIFRCRWPLPSSWACCRCWQMTAGQRDWADVVRLDSHHISLPSGLMQDWPVGSSVTLHTAALLMIAESDNTATDLLIDLLGRDRIAARLGLATQDLLTTREILR